MWNGERWKAIPRDYTTAESLSSEWYLHPYTVMYFATAQWLVLWLLTKQVKDEGWWLVIGNPQTWELYALKRVSFLDHLNSTLVLPESVIPHQVQLCQCQCICLHVGGWCNFRCIFQVLRDMYYTPKLFITVCKNWAVQNPPVHLWCGFFMQDLNDSQCLFVCLFFFQPMKLHLVSDCYIGLDQEYEIRGSSWHNKECIASEVKYSPWWSTVG
jgi:hypothetical protein